MMFKKGHRNTEAGGRGGGAEGTRRGKNKDGEKAQN